MNEFNLNTLVLYFKYFYLLKTILITYPTFGEIYKEQKIIILNVKHKIKCIRAPTYIDCTLVTLLSHTVSTDKSRIYVAQT